MPRILIVKMSSMGDVVHAQPLATDLKAHCPDAQIDWVVESAFSALPALNPAVHEVIPISWRRWRKSLGKADTRKALGDFLRTLQARRYDWILRLAAIVWGPTALLHVNRSPHWPTTRRSTYRVTGTSYAATGPSERRCWAMASTRRPASASRLRP